MTSPMIGRVRWVASTREGVAHAVPPRGRVTRGACGQPVLPDSMSWPERSRCPRCLAAIGLLPFTDDAS